MANNDLEQVIELTKDKLDVYIRDVLKVPIDGNGKFSCLLGKHTDSTPSMAIYPKNKQLAHCFSCGATVNIYQIAAAVQGLPCSGEEWVLHTVPTLAKLLNIPYEPKELTPEQKFKISLYKIYNDANSILINCKDKTTLSKYLKIRNIRDDVANYMGIGIVESYKIFYDKLLALGYDPDLIHKADLDNPRIFNHNNLIFTINNDNGNPVGFVARNMQYEEAVKAGDSEAIKYINSKQSPIYNKGSLLYNFDKALANTPPLYICEGYIDAISGIQKGIPNLVALGSAAFTDSEYGSHIKLLQKYSVKDIIIIPDVDKPGIASLEKTLDIFSKHPEFKVRIILLSNLNNKKVDLDSYLQTHTLEEFKMLPKLSVFDYKLSKYDDGKNYNADGADICKEMIPYIINEKSKVDQYQLVQKLASKSGIPADVIQKEIDAHFNEQDYLRLQKVKDLKKDINYILDRTTNEDEIKESITNKLINFTAKEEVIENDAESNKQRILALKEDLLTRENSTFILNDFAELGKSLDGIPKKAVCFAIPAVSNIGKSTMVRHLAYDIIKNNPNSICLMITIDDSFEKAVTTFVTLESGLKISEVAKPKLMIRKDRPYYDIKMKMLQEGWERFAQYSNRIIVKDASDKVNTTFNIRRLIECYKNQYHDKDLFVVIDNFHNLTDFPNLATTERMAEISRLVKEMSVIYNIPIFNVMELRKSDDFKGKHTLDDIKSAGDIVYDVDVVLMIHQDLHVDPDESYDYWYDPENGRDYNNQLIKYPINIVNIAKTKISGFKSNTYWRFRTDRARFYNITGTEFHTLRECNKNGKDAMPYTDNIIIGNTIQKVVPDYEF